MDSSINSNTSVNSSPSNSSAGNITAKMRRLKIQEELLIQSIKKSMPTSYGDNENKLIKTDLEFKKYVMGLKTSYADIKQLFEDIKCTTKSQEILKTLDIDDIKKDVLDLDHKIKAFKTFLKQELSELKNTEKDLIKQLEDDALENIKTKKNTKLATKSYSDIVPSPVKNLINSPLKSLEVQKFQDFISNTSKHGGWNEYNHNIFVRIWQKHFEQREEDGYINPDTMDYIERDYFIDEVIEKISGVKRNSIISHMKWYSKYLYLKNRQRIALDEWRAKTKPKTVHHLPEPALIDKKTTKTFNTQRSRRRKFSSSRNSTPKYDGTHKVDCLSDDNLMYSQSTDENNFYNCVDANEFFKEMDHARNDWRRSLDNEQISSEFEFAKPTKQWKNRCNSKSDLRLFNKNLDDISKLGIPSWRIGLSNEI